MKPLRSGRSLRVERRRPALAAAAWHMAAI
jgi:hypothetical protein